MSKRNRLMQHITVFEKAAKYGDRSAFLDKLAQMAPETNAVVPSNAWTNKELEQANQTAPQGIPAPDPNLANQPAPLTPPPPMTAPAPREQWAAIPKDVQQALVSLRIMPAQIQSAKGPVSSVDGFRGPQTEKALSDYKSRFKLAPGLSNDQLFASIRAQSSASASAGSAKNAPRPFANS